MKYSLVPIYVITLFLMGTYGYAVLRSPIASAQAPATTAPQQVTTGPPVVHNGDLGDDRFETIIPGIGSGNIVWTFTNESRTEGIRCEYGGIAGQAPRHEPTPRTGSLIAPGVSLTERTAPSNRLDCIAVEGRPKYDITMYPK